MTDLRQKRLADPLIDLRLFGQNLEHSDNVGGVIAEIGIDGGDDASARPREAATQGIPPTSIGRIGDDTQP